MREIENPTQILQEMLWLGRVHVEATLARHFCFQNMMRALDESCSLYPNPAHNSKVLLQSSQTPFCLPILCFQAGSAVYTGLWNGENAVLHKGSCQRMPSPMTRRNEVVTRGFNYCLAKQEVWRTAYHLSIRVCCLLVGWAGMRWSGGHLTKPDQTRPDASRYAQDPGSKIWIKVLTGTIKKCIFRMFVCQFLTSHTGII